LPRKAREAILQAIEATKQTTEAKDNINQIYNTFVLSRAYNFASIDSEGDKALFALGNNLGFNMLVDFSGFSYVYMGIFTALRPEIILWRISTLNEIWKGRLSSLPKRLELGMVDKATLRAIDELVKKLSAWIIVNSESDKQILEKEFDKIDLGFPISLFTLDEIEKEISILL